MICVWVAMPVFAAIDLDRSLDLELKVKIIPEPRSNPRNPNVNLYTRFKYRLFVPPDHEEGGRKFPLVLFLHGAGERGDDNLAQVTHHIDGLIEATQSQAYSAYLLAPQLPANNPRDTNENPDLPQSNDELFKRILDTVLSDYEDVDTSRIYVTGLSLGGFGTFDMIAEFPDLFAASVPLSGGGDPRTAEIIKDVPLWIFHSRTDNVVPFVLSQIMFDAVTAAEGDPMLTEMPFEGHGGWDAVYRDENHELYPWLFRQSIPEPSTIACLAGFLCLSVIRRRR